MIKNKLNILLIVCLLLLIISIYSAVSQSNKSLYGRLVIKNDNWYIENNRSVIRLLKPPDSYLKKINFNPEFMNNKKIYIIGYCFDKNILRPHTIQYNSYNYNFEDKDHNLLWKAYVQNDKDNNKKNLVNK